MATAELPGLALALFGDLFGIEFAPCYQNFGLDRRLRFYQ
jgi:hypothetical protein